MKQHKALKRILMRRYASKPSGWVVVDFANPALAYIIYGSNF